MNIEIKHMLPRDEARSRITGLIGKLRMEYGGHIQHLKEEWVGYMDKIEGTAKGYSISGTIDVEELTVNIHLKVPFVLRVFSGKIRSVIEDQVGKELNSSIH